MSATETLAGEQRASTGLNAGLAIVLAILAVHLTSLIFPYYFVDDVWLYRRQESGFPDRYYTLAIQQGRPLMAALALGTQLLRSRFGIEAMLVVRALAAATVMVFAYSVYRFLRLWQSPVVAVSLSILLVTLPSFQMYVSAAPLFAPALAYCGFAVLTFGRFVFREEKRVRDWALVVFTALGLTLVWATYQGIALVVVGLLTPLALSGEMDAAGRRRALVVFLVCVGMSLAVYYGGWRILNIGIPSDGRYSPRIDRFYLFENWPFYRIHRFPQIFGFWDTRQGIVPYFIEAAAVVAAACALDLVHAGVRRVARAQMWAFSIAAVIAVDLPSLLVPPSSNLSYMTSAPAATAAFMLVAISVVKLFDEILVRLPSLRLAVAPTAVFLCAGAVVLAARNVTVNHVVPNWLEYALVRAELRRSLTMDHRISLVTVHTRGSLLASGRNEFGWGSFGGSFWVHWAVRDILDELGQNSNVRIDVVNGDGSTETSIESLRAGWLVPPASDRQVTIDLRGIDLRAPPGAGYRESPPLPTDDSALPPPPPEALPPPPEGLSLVPIDDIQSTLTFASLSAKGERAAIDGDRRTPAADPKGLTPATSVVLRWNTSRPVAGLRVVTAQQYGVSNPVAFSVTCDAGGVPRALGTIVVRAGTDVVDDVRWEPPCETRVLRLAPTPGSHAGNFWIAEFQVFAPPSDSHHD
jgi:hypothetical protein